MICAPGVIRTRDPLLRRQMLYPAELQAQKSILFLKAGPVSSLQVNSQAPLATLLYHYLEMLMPPLNIEETVDNNSRGNGPYETTKQYHHLSEKN